MTSDGILLALHDVTLDRSVRGDSGRGVGPVIGRTLAELRARFSTDETTRALEVLAR